MLPQLISLRTLSATEGSTYDWHSHPFQEFTLVTDDSCLIGYPPGWLHTDKGKLLHYHSGERHGAWVSPQQRPRFWVLHFQADEELYPTLRQLNAAAPEQRVWALTPEQLEMFQWFFLQMLNEQSAGRVHRQASISAWLQLLLISVDRWASRLADSPTVLPSQTRPEVVRLWHRVNEAVSRPNDELKDLYSTPNYDSVRHAFRKTFGCSPREMLQRLRMEHAKTLLLESSLSIKEIAIRVGYVEQHNFNRMFHRYAGVAPSVWRTNPFSRSAKA